jgi:hypothetical protein
VTLGDRVTLDGRTLFESDLSRGIHTKLGGLLDWVDVGVPGSRGLSFFVCSTSFSVGTGAVVEPPVNAKR